jgi:hypothetical protein
MIGHAETVQRGQTKFKYICPAIYKKEWLNGKNKSSYNRWFFFIQKYII